MANALDVLKTKNCEIDSKVLELQKLNEKLVKDRNTLDVLKTKNCELESKLLELTKLKEKWLDDSNGFDDLRNNVLEDKMVEDER